MKDGIQEDNIPELTSLDPNPILLNLTQISPKCTTLMAQPMASSFYKVIDQPLVFTFQRQPVR